MHDDGRQPIAIGHLSYSGDPKIVTFPHCAKKRCGKIPLLLRYIHKKYRIAIHIYFNIRLLTQTLRILTLRSKIILIYHEYTYFVSWWYTNKPNLLWLRTVLPTHTHSKNNFDIEAKVQGHTEVKNVWDMSSQIIHSWTKYGMTIDVKGQKSCGPNKKYCQKPNKFDI